MYTGKSIKEIEDMLFKEYMSDIDAKVKKDLHLYKNEACAYMGIATIMSMLAECDAGTIYWAMYYYNLQKDKN